MTLCLRRIAPQASFVFRGELFILPGDLELPGPPTLLPHGDKDVTRVVGSYNLASHYGKFGNRPGCKQPAKLKHQAAGVSAWPLSQDTRILWWYYVFSCDHARSPPLPSRWVCTTPLEWINDHHPLPFSHPPQNHLSTPLPITQYSNHQVHIHFSIFKFQNSTTRLITSQ